MKIQTFELGRYFEEIALTTKLAELTKAVNRSLCENVEVVDRADGRFLGWDERQDEMISYDDFMTLRLGENWLMESYKPEQERAARLEYKQICESFPARKCELPLTRAQAFALVVACYIRESRQLLCEQSLFAPEIEALL
jgi:hypothetical protein